MPVLVKFKRTDPSAIIPEYKSKGAAAFDICVIETRLLRQNQYAALRTGIAVELPEGYKILIVGRSSTPKYGLRIVPGIIDCDYRGDIHVQVEAYEEMTIHSGARIAQCCVEKIERAELIEVDELTPTERGECGFGQFSGV